MSEKVAAEDKKFVDSSICEFHGINSELRCVLQELQRINYKLGFSYPEPTCKDDCSSVEEIPCTFKDELNSCLDSYRYILNELKHELNQMNKNV